MTIERTTKMRDQTVIRSRSVCGFYDRDHSGGVHTNDGKIMHSSVRIKLLSQVRDQQQRQEDGDTHGRQLFGGTIIDEVELGSQDTDPDGYQD